MKFLYDGLSFTFTPQNSIERQLLIGFSCLDIVTHSFNDEGSPERLAKAVDGYDGSIMSAIRLVKEAVDSDCLMTENPPEDEDEDDLPEIPFINGAA